MFRKKVDLVDRPENEPKFDPNNKTDRKIVTTLLLVALAVAIIVVIIILLIRKYI